MIIKLLNDLGISYNEKVRKYASNKNIEGKSIQINYKCTIDRDLMRVIAKIVFNYFIYCTEQDGSYYKNFLYEANFDKLRNFIYNGSGDWKEIVKFSKQKAILDIEGDGSIRILAHTIQFTLKGDLIMAKISLFGQWIYEVEIGKYPLSTQTKFGCGHMFDPFSKSIHPIGPDKYSLNRLTDSGFGWFKI